MSVHHFGTNIAICHVAFEGDTLPQGAQDLSVELLLWLNAKQNEQKWRDQGTPDGTLNGPRSFLAQQKMRDLAERSLVAARRGFRPELANEAGYLTTVGSALAARMSPLVDHLAQNTSTAWDPTTWVRADELFITAAIPVNVVKILNLFYVAVTKTERKFAEVRQTSGDLNQFQIPGTNLFTTPNNAGTPTGNFIRAQMTESPRTPIPTFVPLPTSTLPGVLKDTTQQFDETNTYLMQTALNEGSMWHAWVPVSIFQPSTRTAMRYLYRLGLVDLRAFSTQGRGRPRLIVRTSSVGERLLRHLANENML